MLLSRIPLAVGLLGVFLLTAPASGQTHPFPGSTAEPLVICTGCRGFNSIGEENEGKPTFPYDLPLANHTGRWLSSEQVPSVQNVGMRTIRAGDELRIRGNRLYLKLGSTIGVYPLDTFFTTRLAEPMISVSSLATGYRYGQRSPFERLARPDAWIYPEAKTSGWDSMILFDSYERLADFDVDDRGHVYYGSNIWGWGIHHDDGRSSMTHLPFVSRVNDSTWNHQITHLFTMKVEQSYYAYVSSQFEARLYDVTDAAQPELVSKRAANRRVVRGWAKHDASERVAFVNSENAILIYSYAALAGSGAPQLTQAPAAGRVFMDVAFDEDGTLWAVETPSDTTTYSTVLWRFTLTPLGYQAETWPVDTGLFHATVINAGAGYVTLGGKSKTETEIRSDLRLYRITDGTPEPVDTAGYFPNYYASAPGGFADPYKYTNQTPHLFPVAQHGRTFLIYAGYGLGDVYELQTAPPPDAPVNLVATGSGATSVSLTWSAVPDAVQYELFRRGGGQAILPVPGQAGSPVLHQFVSIGKTSATSFTDTGLALDTAYAYSVRALNATGAASPLSAIDTATTVVFTDETVVPGMPIKAVHITDLRRAAAALGALAGLAPPALTDPELARGTIVKRVHLAELAAYANTARQTLGAAVIPFSTSAVVRAVDVDSARAITR
jgi:hypothetical protein